MKEKFFYVSAGFFACLALVFVSGNFPVMPPAHAQVHGASAGSTTVALGDLQRGVFPIVVVDSVDNSILLYEADISRTRWQLELKNARTYRYDKQITELNTEPEISQVRQRLDRGN